MAISIAVCNQKGGVGKTTTVFHLARAAVKRGMRVLVIDLDPQGNLTAVASEEPLSADRPGLADALSNTGRETMASVIVPGVWPGLDLVPTTGEELASVRNELVVASVNREYRLRDALRQVTDRYDLILMDCAPALDQLAINALTASDKVLVVTHSKLFASHGLDQLMSAVESVQTHCNPKLKIAGVLVNQHEDKTVSGRSWLVELQQQSERLGLKVFDPPVPKRVVISDAVEASVGLDEYGSEQGSAMAELYDEHLLNLITD